MLISPKLQKLLHCTSQLSPFTQNTTKLMFFIWIFQAFSLFIYEIFVPWCAGCDEYLIGQYKRLLRTYHGYDGR